jgi:hypothetical protein
MKRTFSLIIIICWAFAACQATPEEGVVKSKKDDTFMDILIDTKEGTTAIPQKSTNTSEGNIANNMFADYTTSWKGAFKVKPYNIQVDIDAEVITPVTDSLPVYKVAPAKITQEQVDGFLSSFGEATYHLNINIKTKSYYEQAIIDAKQRIAEIPNQDKYTKAEKEQLVQQHKNSIEYFKSFIKDAPETLNDEIEPIFTNKYIIARDSEGGQAVDNEDNGDRPEIVTAQEEYERTNTESINIKWTTDNIQMTLDVLRSDSLLGNEFIFYSANRNSVYSGNATAFKNTSDLKGLNTTYEEAKAMAEEAVSNLNMGYMMVAESGKIASYKGDINRYDTNAGYTDFEKLEHNDLAYIFYFTRSINGVNQTYCANSISYNQYAEPWEYVNFYVIVNDSGIVEINWRSTGSELGEQISDNSELLSFDEIQQIAEQQFSNGNIDFSRGFDDESDFSNLIEMNLKIDEVTLGYARVELSDGGGYVMIPAWDFFGSYTAIILADDKKSIKYSEQSEYYMQSYLTINAIDGSVIDRSLGY